MNPVSRAKAMLVDPAAAWTAIETESGEPAFLLSRYVALLALIPALASFIGASLIGTLNPNGIVVRAPLFDGVFGATFGYVENFALILALGLIINLAAPLFGARKSFDSALKLAVYAYTAVWLSGIFLLLPGLRFLMLIGCYAAYALWLGLAPLMKVPPTRAAGYAVTIVIGAAALTVAAAAAQGALFNTPGL